MNLEIKDVVFTLEELDTAVSNVMFFEEGLREKVVKLLSEGKYVMVYVEHYIGNGKWRKNEYKYKVLIPACDNTGRLYSTDVYKEPEIAADRAYGIYIHTQQNALKIVSHGLADWNPRKFERYQKYGVQMIELEDNEDRV